MTKTDLEQVMDVVIAKASALRGAGVTSLAIGDLSLELAPPLQEAPPDDNPDATEEEAAKEKQRGRGVFDPDLYPGGKVPGRQRPSKE